MLSTPLTPLQKELSDTAAFASRRHDIKARAMEMALDADGKLYALYLKYPRLWGNPDVLRLLADIDWLLAEAEDATEERKEKAREDGKREGYVDAIEHFHPEFDALLDEVESVDSDMKRALDLIKREGYVDAIEHFHPEFDALLDEVESVASDMKRALDLMLKATKVK